MFSGTQQSPAALGVSSPHHKVTREPWSHGGPPLVSHHQCALHHTDKFHVHKVICNDILNMSLEAVPSNLDQIWRMFERPVCVFIRLEEFHWPLQPPLTLMRKRMEQMLEPNLAFIPRIYDLSVTQTSRCAAASDQKPSIAAKDHKNI